MSLGEEEEEEEEEDRKEEDTSYAFLFFSKVKAILESFS